MQLTLHLEQSIKLLYDEGIPEKKCETTSLFFKGRHDL